MNLPSLNRFGEMARIQAAETESSEKWVERDVCSKTNVSTDQDCVNI